jgi:phosphoribosyl 1,2-cyclic phosphodiesterase
MAEGFIKFFGTGGARFVVSRQVRATGGMWIRYRETDLYVDPGPGAIVRISSSKESFDPSRLDGIVLTHKHIDHSNDVNVIAEAMTEGGFKRRGVIFCPEDATEEDPVILRYVRSYVERIEFLKEGGQYNLKDLSFSTPLRHRHPVETYGLLFHFPKKLALISDSRYFEELKSAYRAEILIVNVLRWKSPDKFDAIDHLSIEDFVEIVRDIRPEIAIMTHFGMQLIKQKPHLIAERLKRETGVNIIAAYDGMKFEF